MMRISEPKFNEGDMVVFDASRFDGSQCEDKRAVGTIIASHVGYNVAYSVLLSDLSDIPYWVDEEDIDPATPEDLQKLTGDYE
jgi:hypothetical protein